MTDVNGAGAIHIRGKAARKIINRENGEPLNITDGEFEIKAEGEGLFLHPFQSKQALLQAP